MENIKVILTSKETDDRLQVQDDIFFSEKNEDKQVDIIIDQDKRYQEIIGFGGAFTEAAAYTLSRISKKKRQEVIDSYFSTEDGLNYNLGRVHIQSCDFTRGNYTYVEENDKELETFDISHEKQWVLPLIKDAIKTKGGEIKLMATPWSPPPWMKSNGEMNHGGKLLPEYREVWAKFYTKFIKSYQDEGIDIWAISIQNEPAAVQTWDSCIYSAEEERDFVKGYLGPIMEEEGLDNVKILVWDHNRDIIVERVKPIMDDPEAAKYVWGTAFHWYVSEEFENVGKVHDLYPEKHLLFTEGCQEGGCKVGEWYTGERYGRNMIGDLSNWTEGYIDWNLVLDEKGGPNHVGNYCDAPIIVDTETEELHYNSSFYYIGHFSKYIKPGAVRIGFVSNNDKLNGTAFLNIDGSKVVVIMNETDQAEDFSLSFEDKVASTKLPAHSIASYLF